MSSALFSMMDLEALVEGRMPGTRLHALEVRNWGTFNNDVWRFEVNGRNALLTGDIGSGKSTLVDALTTLLLPAHKIAYNKAAGANTKERTLRSYVQGHFKSEQNETTGTSRPVALRDARQYSVVLAVFKNADFDTTITLVQVFWTKDANAGQPERFYAVANRELDIRETFSSFGDIAALRRRLRKDDVRVYDTFPEYGKDFRRQLGIESEQAMELFHQTVSMKAVDNLNDFVRKHMLEPFDTQAHVTALVDHFDDLTRTHDAVLRARKQIELLDPLIADLDLHDQLTSTVTAAEAQRDAVPHYFATQKLSLLETHVQAVEASITACEAAIAEVNQQLDDLRRQDTELSVQIAGNGGNRISALEADLARLESDKIDRKARFDRFRLHLETAGLEPVATASQFSDAKQQALVLNEQLLNRQADLQNALTDLRVELRDIDEDAKEINAELRSLQTRRNNLPLKSLNVRRQLCEHLGIDESDLPFAGELLQVREDAGDWEGAAERVLHNFALSLLVPNAQYEPVAAWINSNHLGARLVYYRVPATVARIPSVDRNTGDVLLLDKIDIKPDCGFEDWLEAELTRRADHVCVQDMHDFRRARKAITPTGQVKDNARHEKDDRKHIGDRREYVLGWSNEQKIDALIIEGQRLLARQAQCQANVASTEKTLRASTQRSTALTSLDEYTTWAEIDWETAVNLVSATQAELHRLRESSNVLAQLTATQTEVRAGITATAQRVAALQNELGASLADETRTAENLERVRALLREHAATKANVTDLADAIRAIGGETLTLASIDRMQGDVERAITQRIDLTRERQRPVASRIIKGMHGFRTAYPQEVTEMDDSLASGAEFRQLHERVSKDDLPRFEREFKDYLNQNTIRDIAGFSAQLNKHEKLIRDRVETINESMAHIEYSAGRYIRLLPAQTTNAEVREFRSALRACTDNLVGSAHDEQYSEQKFLQVKQLIDRFKGRDGTAEQDRVWTRRVTDVRNWFMFSASERWREDDTEHENYTDSGGKSGGQKEKLAYTILAASLAYQFKLDWGTAKSKSFRFVVIDEAFGRGSEDSTEYALKLFTLLGLQLLIVTPLQKIHVIEPHVSAVGYVDNPDGNYSRLQGLTIEELRRRRQTVDGSEPAEEPTSA